MKSVHKVLLIPLLIFSASSDSKDASMSVTPEPATYQAVVTCRDISSTAHELQLLLPNQRCDPRHSDCVRVEAANARQLFLAANEPSLENVTSAVRDLCQAPSKRGRYLEYEGTATGGVLIRMIGVEGKGKITKKEWDGIQLELDKDRPANNAGIRSCVRDVLPLILRAYGR